MGNLIGFLKLIIYWKSRICIQIMGEIWIFLFEKSARIFNFGARFKTFYIKKIDNVHKKIWYRKSRISFQMMREIWIFLFKKIAGYLNFGIKRKRHLKISILKKLRMFIKKFEIQKNTIFSEDSTISIKLLNFWRTIKTCA